MIEQAALQAREGAPSSSSGTQQRQGEVGLVQSSLPARSCRASSTRFYPETGGMATVQNTSLF